MKEVQEIEVHDTSRRRRPGTSISHKFTYMISFREMCHLDKFGGSKCETSVFFFFFSGVRLVY
jgi:hypothetical protein